jgi:hypothetical protein
MKGVIGLVLLLMGKNGLRSFKARKNIIGGRHQGQQGRLQQHTWQGRQ